MIRHVESRRIGPDDFSALDLLQAKGIFNLREGDEKECIALGMTPQQAVTKSVEISVVSYAVLVNDILILTWGYSVKNPLSGIAYPWLLTTPELSKYKMFFARNSIRVRDFLLERYNRLDVLVAADYLRAHAWLEWLGFSSPGPAIPINGVNFVYMILERKNGRPG